MIDDPLDPEPDRRSGHDRRRAPDRAHRDPDAVDVTRGEHWELEDAIDTFARRATWALRFVALVVVGTAVAVALLAESNSERVDDLEAQADAVEAQSDANAQQADQIAELVATIEDTRRDAILRACRETNRRHDRSFKALDLLSAQAIEREPERAAEIRIGTEQFKVFVNALVPRRDCPKRADQLTAPPPALPTPR